MRVGYALDGETGDSLLLYINHRESQRANVRFALLDRANGRFPIAISKRKIYPGEELFAQYE